MRPPEWAFMVDPALAEENLTSVHPGEAISVGVWDGNR